MSQRIRPVDKSEISGVLELWKAADSHPSITDTVADIERLLGRDHASLLVAEIDGRIIGTIIVTFDGWRGIIYRLAVDPDQRRKGVAAELLRSGEEIFRQWGVRRAIAIVDTTRPSAMGFWTAAGYTNDEMTRFFKNIQDGSIAGNR